MPKASKNPTNCDIRDATDSAYASISEDDLQWRLLVLEQGLSQLGQAILLLSSRGEVVFSSSAAACILAENDGLGIIEKNLVAAYEADNKRLLETIQLAFEKDATPEQFVKHTLHIHRPSNKQPYHLRIMQLPKCSPLDRRVGHEVMVILRDLDANYSGWCKRLKEQFNLTPRECECTILLTEGRDLKEIADRMNLRHETMRQHLKSIFKKMNVQKQHELVSLALDYRRKR